MILNQLGVGPKDPFSITDGTSTWSDFSTTTDLEALKTYVYIRTKILFDPPDKSYVLESYNKILQELEWRIVAQVERGE